MSFSRVYSVEAGDFAISKKNPPDIVVSALGEVPTSGWQNGHLTEWVYIQPPEDGIQDFDFVAEKPTGIVLQAFQKITGHGVLIDVEIADYWGTGMPLKGFRIHAATNSIEISLDDGGKSLTMSL